jgi:precorrin-8X/cobalt-precorrin-8 methylmutase
MFDYIRDPAEIYEKSFAAVRAEADLTGFAPGEEEVAVRLIHACGMPDIAPDLVFGGARGDVDVAGAGRQALSDGAVVLADVEMVARGIIRARLPAANEVICRLHDEGVRESAAAARTTRSAAAVELWGDDLAGSVVAIGNAPTALYRLLELIEDGAPPPALVCAFPVGFVGAAESKESLIEHAPALGLSFITLRGRRGGSALAAACINALAGNTKDR